MKGDQLQNGSYTSIFEIFVIGDDGAFRVDDTIIYHVYGNSHYTVNTFDSDKISNQYTKSVIQFTSDGGAGIDNGITFQIRYYGSHYNKNVRFLFYSRVIKGKLSTSFDHTIFNVRDVDDNHKILYFENLNLNGNLTDGLGDPVDLANATNKKYVDTKNSQQDIAIADKASKSYVDNEIAKIPQQPQNVLLLNGNKAMTGNLDMGDHTIIGIKSSSQDNVALTVGGAKATYFPLSGDRSMQGDLDMGGNLNINIKPFVEDDSSGAASDTQKNEAITFGYFKDQRGKLQGSIKKVSDNALNRKNPSAMESNIDMDPHSIINLKKTRSSPSHICS